MSKIVDYSLDNPKEIIQGITEEQMVALQELAEEVYE